jgi:hypothetical protein
MRAHFDAPMAWGTYMLRSSVVFVIIRFWVKARENSFRFEMICERWKFLVTFIRIMVLFRFELMYRTQYTPTTVNREHQHGAKEVYQ